MSQPQPGPMPLRDLNVVSRPLSDLKPHPKNARTHSDRQLHQLVRSIDTFGFTIPVLVDDANVILAGHARVEAARRLGLDCVPTIQIGDLSDSQKRAYLIADNRLAQLSGWDGELLAQELAALTDHAGTLDFDLEATGFDWGEIDVLVAGGDMQDAGRSKILGKGASRRKVEPEDRPVEPQLEKPAISRSGQLWQLGEHRLLVGDSTHKASYERLLGAVGGEAPELADLVFTDPPYNVPIAGHVSGLGSVQHREFAMASGEMSQAQFTAFLHTVFALMAGSSRDGALHFICMDWRHMREVLEASQDIYTELKNVCVWNKDNAGMGSLYRSKHELIFVQKVGQAPHVNHVQLGAKGRYRTNVWDYPGVNSFAGQADLEMHPTVKPIGLIADALRDCSNRHGIVLDPFGGSGSTLIAAEKTKRRARLIEIDPHYGDTIVRRWQKVTGKVAVDADSGASFADLKAQRAEVG